MQDKNGEGMISLLIVADQPAMRKGLQMRLSAEPDLSVVGEALDGETALNLALSLCPDIVLIDADMPHNQGIATAETIHQICPNSRVIIISIHDDALLCQRAQDASAAAFVTKSLPANTLIDAIRQVAQP